MISTEQRVLIIRIEKAGLLFRWVGWGVILAAISLGGLPWEWFDLAVGTALILGHNFFVHLALWTRRTEWFATPLNYTVYLLEVTAIVLLTGADESVAYTLYILFLVGLTAYTRGARVVIYSTVMCIALFAGALALEYILVGLSRPWGELALKMLAIGGAGWAVGVLSDQLNRNARAAREHADALATSEATLRTVLDNAADLILVFDEHERIIDVNERACAFLRLPRSEILGQRPRAFFFDDGTLGAKLASLRAHGEFHGEMIIVDADTQEHTVDLLIRGFLRNERRFFVALARDITQQKALEEATHRANAHLERLNRELRQVDEVKREFFGTVSMRMRSPVAAILGYADMLLADELGELNAEQRKALHTCRRSAQRLLGMVEEAVEVGAHPPVAAAATAGNGPESPPKP